MPGPRRLGPLALPPQPAPTMPRVQAIVETAVYADDLAAAEAFYRDVLQLTPWGSEPGRHAFFAVGGQMLLVFRPQATQTGELLPPHGARGAGHFALGIEAADFEAWRTRLAEQGVAIEREVNWPLGGRSLYFRDPAGNSVELLTPGVWGNRDGW